MRTSVLNLANDVRMLDVVRDGLEAADDVRIAVSFTRCSGLGLLIDPLKELVNRGGQARVLTSTYQAITQPAALVSLLRLSEVETRLQQGPVAFHSKFWWFGQQGGGECWAGSSNLSKGGLSTNLEWNIRSTVASDLAVTRSQFDALWTRPDVSALTESAIAKYETFYKSQQERAAYPAPPPINTVDDHPLGEVTPNAAQTEALSQLLALRARGQRRGAVIAATGLGKTYLAAFDIKACKARQVLYVSHRLEHLTQARRAFLRIFGQELSLGLVGGGSEEMDADIVFATVASLKNRPTLIARAWDFLVIDEFHHVEADSYEILRPIREKAFLLGITATPERQDGRDVLEWCDWNIAYEVRLTEAIEREWLLPFHYFGIADETVDFLHVPWRNLAAVESVLSVEERVDHVLHHALERGYDGTARACIGFCAGRAHATYMAEQFNRRGQTALAVLGTISVQEREHAYARLSDRTDPLEWIFVSDVLNEGVDIPAINSVMFLRPTESATLFIQQLGRGLRLCPDTEVLTVLDFVGHHRSAWLTLEALHAPAGSGRRSVIADDFVIKPPHACEIVLQRRTKEILAKVGRFKTRKQACNEAYGRLLGELGRAPRPIDLWDRADVPSLRDFRAAHGTWLSCQDCNDNAPPWTRTLAEDHPIRAFLKAAESDWQAQRVGPYAVLWGLCAQPDEPEKGAREFFERWPHWKLEESALNMESAWATVEKKLGEALVDRRLTHAIRNALGDHLLSEVEGRLLYTLAEDYRARHGGVLRTPGELREFAEYRRPEIIRHFGKRYDPAKHNKGILWFEDGAAIVTKLDTSSAVGRHQYQNRFLAPDLFFWTSQNQMGQDNVAGRRLLDAESKGVPIRLFVQSRSHQPALYVGEVGIANVEANRPMKVTFRLAQALSGDVLLALGVNLENDSSA